MACMFGRVVITIVVVVTESLEGLIEGHGNDSIKNCEVSLLREIYLLTKYSLFTHSFACPVV